MKAQFPEQYRAKFGPEHLYYSKPGDQFGIFLIPASEAKGRGLNVIASSASNLSHWWDHVSVSVYGSHDTPTWEEMCIVKDLFWNEDESCVQFHPAKSEYVNIHPGVLHIWKHVEGHKVPPLKCV